MSSRSMDDESSQSKRMRLPSDTSADYNKVLHTTTSPCNCDRCGGGGGGGGHGHGHAHGPGHVTIIDLD